MRDENVGRLRDPAEQADTRVGHETRAQTVERSRDRGPFRQRASGEKSACDQDRRAGSGGHAETLPGQAGPGSGRHARRDFDGGNERDADLDEKSCCQRREQRGTGERPARHRFAQRRTDDPQTHHDLKAGETPLQPGTQRIEVLPKAPDERRRDRQSGAEGSERQRAAPGGGQRTDGSRVRAHRVEQSRGDALNHDGRLCRPREEIATLASPDSSAAWPRRPESRAVARSLRS